MTGLRGHTDETITDNISRSNKQRRRSVMVRDHKWTDDTGYMYVDTVVKQLGRYALFSVKQSCDGAYPLTSLSVIPLSALSATGSKPRQTARPTHRLNEGGRWSRPGSHPSAPQYPRTRNRSSAQSSSSISSRSSPACST